MATRDRAHARNRVGATADTEASAADPAARRASAEQKIAALKQLISYVLLMARGPERARFEESIARRIGVSLEALRDEIVARERSVSTGGDDAAAGGCTASRRRRRQPTGG